MRQPRRAGKPVGAAGTAKNLLLLGALEDFYGAFDRPNLARREPFELAREGTGFGRLLKYVPSGLREPHGQPAAIVRVGGPLDQANSHQRIDRATYGRSASPDGLSHLVESGGLIRSHCGQENAACPIRAFGRPVRKEELRNRYVSSRDSGR